MQPIGFHAGSQVVMSLDGKMWFQGFLGGASVIDPQHLPSNKITPPVHIEGITANGKTYDASNGLRLPPGIRDLKIDYTALSFVAPEKVQFRYQLEGQDRNWREVANDREAQYSNLPPGDYVFRVTAANNSGVWNEAGAAIEFSIAPAYYQTTWFHVAIATVIMALLWALYQLRMRQLSHEFDLRLDARVNERTRIARELHDTLLQSFLGVKFQLQAARSLLPGRASEAIEALDCSLDQAGQAIKDGREAIEGLRSSTLVQNELADTVATLGAELAAHGSSTTTSAFNVAVEGRARNLRGVVRDDVLRIVAEAVRNAFRHARARRIDVTIRYDDSVFRVLVTDDGIGIDPDRFESYSQGHWGLQGMHERAELLGGALRLMSKPGRGTQVELTVPARRAYASVSYADASGDGRPRNANDHDTFGDSGTSCR